jgi:acyl-CoA synthetase (AMP-forming)/AMP-acid ligase II
MSLHDFIAAREKLTASDGPYAIDVDHSGMPYYRDAAGNLAELLQRGRQHGDKPFLHYDTETVSFEMFYARVDAITALLKTKGIGCGDRCAIAMRNHPDWMAAFVAICQSGATVVPLNSWGKAEELVYALKDCAAKILFCDEAREALLADFIASSNIVHYVSDSDSPHSLNAQLSSIAAACTEKTVTSCPADSAMIMYTSGTGGQARGVISSHDNICQALCNIEMNARATLIALPEAQRQLALSAPPAPTLLCVPLFHVSGCFAIFISALLSGRSLVVMPKWDIEQAMALIEQYRIGTLTAAPSMILALLQHPAFTQYDLSSIRAVAGGGAACPAKMNALCYEKFGRVSLGTGYGMTESNAVGASFSGALYAYKPASAGLLAPIVEIKTCDENGNTLPVGKTGEIYLRSPTVAQGYLNAPAASAATFCQGWLATGDIGYVDDEGFVFIVDRAKDIIIRSGENISAVEVESCLLTLAGVSECAAFAIPSEKHGEELAVAIRKATDSTLDSLAVSEHVREHLAGFKVPSQVYFVDDELPRNAMGKLLKREIRDKLV